jgi:uncharacterized membrane protein YozB (DUF420 family)
MADQAKLQAIPKKNIIIMLIAVTVYALLFVAIAFLINKVGDESSQMSKQSLTNWKIVGILLSLYTLTTPWRWQKKIVSRANQQNMAARQIWGMLILFCFVPFIAPLIYGLVLLFWGLPFLEFYYFVALSVLGALTWSAYNLRKNS